MNTTKITGHQERCIKRMETYRKILEVTKRALDDEMSDTELAKIYMDCRRDLIDNDLTKEERREFEQLFSAIFDVNFKITEALQYYLDAGDILNSDLKAINTRTLIASTEDFKFMTKITSDALGVSEDELHDMAENTILNMDKSLEETSIPKSYHEKIKKAILKALLED